jgi:hypothetical protein
MKTLEKGRKQKGWSDEFRCTGNGNLGGGCGALLLVERDDVYQTYTHCRDDMTIHNTFMCHECGVETDIKNQLPFIPPSKSAWLKARGKSLGEDE